MIHIGEDGQDRKRLRMQEQEKETLMVGPHQPKFSEKTKAICEQEAFLLVRIISAVDVDRDFRAVTNERFYGVVCWINPCDEYRSRPAVPKVFDYVLDPVWDELITVPLGETSAEKAVLHLEVIRGSRFMTDPGSSNGRKVVGRAEFELAQLELGVITKVKLELLEPAGFGWKPEGFIFLEVQLLIFPDEQPIEEVYEPEQSNFN